MINGFKMVKETPIHQPATTYKRSLPIEPSPVITWGKIEDTSFLGLEKGGKSFKIPDTPSRDELGFKMANKLQNKKRDLKQAEKESQELKLSMLTTPTSLHYQKGSQKSSSQELSQAGKKLLETIIREKSQRRDNSGGASTPIIRK